ncbi:Glutamate receptor 2 [Coccomyxa sp. Obi]|nr:Glutamate receptor 2 [Coccomyxa sp. Obi]
MSDLNSSVLRVVAAHRPPFVFIDSSRSGNAAFYGFLVDLLPVLFQTAGLGNYTLNYYTSTNSGGEKLDNGTWTGIMGQLQSREADFAAFPLTLVPGRPVDIDITYSYYAGGLGLLVGKGEPRNDQLLFLQPFDARLWIALLGTAFAAALVLKLLSLYTPLGDSEIHTVHPLDEGEHAEGRKYEVEHSSDSILLETWMAMFGERRGLSIGRSWATRIFAIAFAFFSVVVMGAYTANFASILTVLQVSQPIQSLKDLTTRNGTIAINPSGATKNFFDNTKDPISADAGSRRVYTPDTITGVEAVRNGDVDAYVTDFPTLQWYAGRQPCDLSVQGDNFGPGVLVYGLQKGSPFTGPLNAAMLELYENGKLDTLKRQWSTEVSQCGDVNSNTITNSRLTVTQMTGLFYMLLVFAGAAFLWASGEHVAVMIARRHPKVKRATITSIPSSSRALKSFRRQLSQRSSSGKIDAEAGSTPRRPQNQSRIDNDGITLTTLPK